MRAGVGEAISIIGAGRVGGAIAKALKDSGINVVAVFDTAKKAAELVAEQTGAKVAENPVAAVADADVVFITTPDDVVPKVASALAESGDVLEGKIFIHMSGALTLEALSPLLERRARVIGIHPLQTFADRENADRALKDSVFCVTALRGDDYECAEGLVHRIGGISLSIRDEDRAFYHVAAVIASNFLVMIEHAALHLLEAIGVGREEATRALMPLVANTLANIRTLGVTRALTGPLARGDIGTIRKHLAALEGEAELTSLYRAVSRWGLRIVEERGELSSEIIEEMRKLLC